MKKRYEILKESKTVTLAMEDYEYPKTHLTWYDRVTSVARFTYAGEMFYITPSNNGFVATHERTGRAVDVMHPQKGVPKAVSHALLVLDANCDNFEKVLEYPEVPEFNLSLNLALTNLL